jgi:outer membrane murein-binding lipoprotein Lpp
MTAQIPAHSRTGSLVYVAQGCGCCGAVEGESNKMNKKMTPIVLAATMLAGCQRKAEENNKNPKVLSLNEVQAIERWEIGDADVRKAASDYARRAGYEVKGVSIEFDKDQGAAAYTADVDCKKGSEERILTVTILAFADESGKIYWRAVEEVPKK